VWSGRLAFEQQRRIEIPSRPASRDPNDLTPASAGFSLAQAGSWLPETIQGAQQVMELVIAGNREHTLQALLKHG